MLIPTKHISSILRLDLIYIYIKTAWLVSKYIHTLHGSSEPHQWWKYFSFIDSLLCTRKSSYVYNCITFESHYSQVFFCKNVSGEMCNCLLSLLSCPSPSSSTTVKPSVSSARFWSQFSFCFSCATRMFCFAVSRHCACSLRFSVLLHNTDIMYAQRKK